MTKIKYHRILLIGFILCCCASYIFPSFLSNSYNGTNINSINTDQTRTHTENINSINNKLTYYGKGSVNIFLRSEPAPVGITDYGINPKTKEPYSYNTTSFLGTAKIYSLSASDGTFLPGVSIQLNVVLKFMVGSSAYVYCLQNVAGIYIKSKLLNFSDEIFNCSNPKATMNSTGIIGSGQCNTVILDNVSYSYYGAMAHFSQLQTYPNTFQLKVKSSLINGEPTITFEYKNGNGNWVAYDNATFLTQSGPVNDMNLVVDGSDYSPGGIYYDAEFVLCGKYNYQTAVAQSDTKLDLQLDYYNGHNFQSVPHAFNFGSNTGEKISNISVTPYNYINGNHYVELKYGSGSNFGPLFYPSIPSNLWLIAGLIGVVIIGVTIFSVIYFPLKFKKTDK